MSCTKARAARRQGKRHTHIVESWARYHEALCTAVCAVVRAFRDSNATRAFDLAVEGYDSMDQSRIGPIGMLRASLASFPAGFVDRICYRVECDMAYPSDPTILRPRIAFIRSVAGALGYTWETTDVNILNLRPRDRDGNLLYPDFDTPAQAEVA